MDSSQFYGNLSTEVRGTTTKHNSVFCNPFASLYFETVGSTVPYTVNAVLKVHCTDIVTMVILSVENAF